MVFYGFSQRFFNYNFKINEATDFIFSENFFHISIKIAAIFFLTEYYWRYWALQLSLKNAFTEIFLASLYFDAQCFILIG